MIQMPAEVAKIALEEHFIIPSFLDYVSRGIPKVAADLRSTLLRQLSDVAEERLGQMDSGGDVGGGEDVGLHRLRTDSDCRRRG
jgi:hypothetical protein